MDQGYKLHCVYIIHVAYGYDQKRITSCFWYDVSGVSQTGLLTSYILDTISKPFQYILKITAVVNGTKYEKC